VTNNVFVVLVSQV